jgi:gluconolactonase
MFFVQNAGARAAGTGLAKSAIIQKISLSAVTPSIASQRNASGSVMVEVVDSTPIVMNPNGEFSSGKGLVCWSFRADGGIGATNYKGELLFLGEGQGEAIAPAMYLMNPEPPYNTTSKTVNYFEHTRDQQHQYAKLNCY